MMMSTSTASTTAASSATVIDVDIDSVVADNLGVFPVGAGYKSTAAEHSWVCKESPPVVPFDIQKTALKALEQYVVRQGFAISVDRSRLIGRKRSFLTCSQRKHYGTYYSRTRQCEITEHKRSAVHTSS